MIGLLDSEHSSIPCMLIRVHYEGTRKPTQLLLKQSCEQKLLSFPSFRQVGHWRVPASLLQSSPIQRFLLASLAAMMKQGAIKGRSVERIRENNKDLRNKEKYKCRCERLKLSIRMTQLFYDSAERGGKNGN